MGESAREFKYRLISENEILKEENARLKARVEELEKENEWLPIEDIKQSYSCDSLLIKRKNNELQVGGFTEDGNNIVFNKTGKPCFYYHDGSYSMYVIDDAMYFYIIPQSLKED